MEAHLYSRHFGESQLSLTDALIDISDLASRGVLDQRSSVWISADSPRPDMWMLTDRSTYTYIHRSRTPGFVRVSKASIRWAPDWDSTISNPGLSLSAREISVSEDEDVNITLIVKHRVPGDVVTIIKPDGTKGKLSGGSYTFGGFTVIDLPSYEPKPIPDAGSYEKSHASHMGANHILRSLPKGKRKDLSRYIELMRFTLTEEQMESLQDVHKQMREISKGFVDQLESRFAAQGAPASLLTIGGVTDA